MRAIRVKQVQTRKTGRQRLPNFCAQVRRTLRKCSPRYFTLQRANNAGQLPSAIWRCIAWNATGFSSYARVKRVTRDTLHDCYTRLCISTSQDAPAWMYRGYAEDVSARNVEILTTRNVIEFWEYAKHFVAAHCDLLYAKHNEDKNLFRLPVPRSGSPLIILELLIIAFLSIQIFTVLTCTNSLSDGGLYLMDVKYLWP